jgi:hypothetical protein
LRESTDGIILKLAFLVISIEIFFKSGFYVQTQILGIIIIEGVADCGIKTIVLCGENPCRDVHVPEIRCNWLGL